MQIAKRTIGVKKVMQALFLKFYVPAMQVLVPEGTCVNAIFYKTKVI